MTCSAPAVYLHACLYLIPPPAHLLTLVSHASRTSSAPTTTFDAINVRLIYDNHSLSNLHIYFTTPSPTILDTKKIKMLFSTVFASVALPVLAMASPIERRAGGPAITPIPSNCTVTNPLPHANHFCGNGTVSGWEPSSEALQSKVYQWYLSQPDFQSVNQRWGGCIDQCNGLSGCKSAFMAYNAPTPKGYFGTQGGALEVGCLFFNRTLTPLDFVPAVKGQYVNATAGNIYCPSAASTTVNSTA